MISKSPREPVPDRDGGKTYRFYGSGSALLKTVTPVTSEYAGIRNPYDLYDALWYVWCAETCAPRMRDRWSPDNPSLGQCSVTAFLAQDVFGGTVYGILRPGGNYHCYNEARGAVFDLTSEQFGEEKLQYDGNPEQFREVHFQKEEKEKRYELLKKRLSLWTNRQDAEQSFFSERERVLRKEF